MRHKTITQVLAIMIALAALAGCQQKQTFVLTGQLEGVTDGKVILEQFMNDNSEADTADIVDGAFVLEGNFPEPTQVMLMIEGRQMSLYFYAENAAMSVTGHADTLYSAKVVGGQVNDDERTYRDGTMEFYKKYHLDSLYKVYMENRSEETMDEINAATALYDADVEVFEAEFIKANPSAYYSAILAKQMSFGLSADEIQGIIDMLDPELQETDLITSVAEEMEMLRQTDVSVVSFTNEVPDIDYQVDPVFAGKEHMNIKYLATFPNNDICGLRNDGSLTVITSEGQKIQGIQN